MHIETDLGALYKKILHLKILHFVTVRTVDAQSQHRAINAVLKHGFSGESMVKFIHLLTC